MDPIVWTWSLVAGAVVVVVVAALLVAILATARAIDRHAREVWQAGQRIAGNTASLWMLESARDAARGLRREVRAIREALGARGGGGGSAA